MLPRAIIGIATALLVAAMPAGARAAIAPADNGAYYPQNGTELLEAVDALADPINWSTTAILLADKTYVVDRPIILDGQDTDVIRPVDGAHPVITGTSGATLLKMRGENYRVDDVLFRAPATQSTYPLVELRGRAQFRSSVEVPAHAPNVTGILTTPSGLADDYSWSNTIGDVTSNATNAPAVKVTGTARFDGTVAGGDPTIDIDLAPTAGQPTDIWFRGDLAGGPDTRTVLQVRTNKLRLPLTTHNATITALRPGATGIRVRGATKPSGSLDLHLYTSSIDLVEGGTAIAVEPGAETKPTTIDAIGLLALGSGTAIACAPPSAAIAAKITINSLYREAENAPTSACTIAEQRRITGDPKFTDRDAGDLTPLWGSVLIDAAPAIVLDGYYNLSTYTKPSAGDTSPENVNDIGAAEYQYTPPKVDREAWEALDNRGLVRLTAHATDPDPTDQDTLVYLWQFPDGTTAEGATVIHRWPQEPTGSPDWTPVRVTDRSGNVRYGSVGVQPLFELAQPYRILDPAAVNFPIPGVPTPTPTPALTSTSANIPPNLPTRPQPTPAATTRPIATAAPVQATIDKFMLLSSRIQRSGRRQTGVGPARDGEAGVAIRLTTPASINLTVTRVGSATILATRRLRLAGGDSRLHVTPNFGRTRLRAGLYDITASTTGKITAPIRVRVTR